MFSNEPITCSQGRILREVAGISPFNKEEASFLGGLLEGMGIKGSGNKPPINKEGLRGSQSFRKIFLET